MADSRDILGKNRKFTGTSGIKLPVGNTSQRDTGIGQGAIRFNSETATAEYYDGSNWQAISSPPTVSSVTPTNVISSDGSTTTFTITGANFTTAGATASFVGDDGSSITADSTTVNSTTSITAVITSSGFANSKEPYDVKIANNTGLSSSLADAITVDNRPAWSTSAGSLGSVSDTATGTHFTLSATDPEGDTVTYAVTTGSLPGGMSLNSSTGAISGDPTNVGSSTTTTFTVTATSTGDVTLTAARQFSITVTPAPTGGTITSYSTYTVHTFTSPGTFNTVSNISGADILLVGGGGGGGGHHAGAGGAGGMIELPNNTIPANPYSIAIGSGGGSSSTGGDTTGFGQTAKGGGKGGNYTGPNAGSGGSGGGGGGGPANSPGPSNQPSVQAPWSGNAYGNAGGSGDNGGGSVHGGGGGGGAAGAGTTANPGQGGNGGNGRQNAYLDGTNDYYAAGGGGGGWDGPSGAGGTGGGGNGSRYNSNGSNASGYGCGGGASGGQSRTGGSGSAGIVVIRFQ